MKLNEKILHYRKAEKLSQEELAVQIGVSRQAVSKWELGDATPEVDKLLALARVFGVTTDELLSENDPVDSQRQDEAFREESSSHTESNTPAEDGFDRATGRIGRLIRKYGWLAGVYVFLCGLGGVIVGALARWGFGTMLGTANQLMGGFDGSVIYNGPPELKDEVLGQFGLSAASSPFGSVDGFAIGFANVIILIGVVTMIAGAVLAVILYRKGNKKS